MLNWKSEKDPEGKIQENCNLKLENFFSFKRQIITKL